MSHLEAQAASTQPRAQPGPLGSLPWPQELASGRPKVEDVALSTTRHFADNPHEVSVDLTWDEVRPLILDWGFVLEREEWRRCTYTRNPASLYQMEYECIFFVARWPGGATAPGSTPPPPPPPPPPSDEPAPPPPPAAS